MRSFGDRRLTTCSENFHTWKVPHLGVDGALPYLAHCTRLYISYTSPLNWCLKMFFRYSKATTDLGLFYHYVIRVDPLILGMMTGMFSYAGTSSLPNPHRALFQMVISLPLGMPQYLRGPHKLDLSCNVFESMPHPCSFLRSSLSLSTEVKVSRYDLAYPLDSWTTPILSHILSSDPPWVQSLLPHSFRST